MQGWHEHRHMCGNRSRRWRLGNGPKPVAPSAGQYLAEAHCIFHCILFRPNNQSPIGDSSSTCMLEDIGIIRTARVSITTAHRRLNKYLTDVFWPVHHAACNGPCTMLHAMAHDAPCYMRWPVHHAACDGTGQHVLPWGKPISNGNIAPLFPRWRKIWI